jgi:hypothetical protein
MKLLGMISVDFDAIYVSQIFCPHQIFNKNVSKTGTVCQLLADFKTVRREA